MTEKLVNDRNKCHYCFTINDKKYVELKVKILKQTILNKVFDWNFPFQEIFNGITDIAMDKIDNAGAALIIDHTGVANMDVL